MPCGFRDVLPTLAHFILETLPHCKPKRTEHRCAGSAYSEHVPGAPSRPETANSWHGSRSSTKGCIS